MGEHGVPRKEGHPVCGNEEPERGWSTLQRYLRGVVVPCRGVVSIQGEVHIHFAR